MFRDISYTGQTNYLKYEIVVTSRVCVTNRNKNRGKNPKPCHLLAAARFLKFLNNSTGLLYDTVRRRIAS